MAFMDILIYAARVCQLLFSLIVLGCTASLVNAFDGNGLDAYTPSQISFLLFVSVWSMLVVGFQIFVPRFSEQLSHKFVILGLDAITMLFWFAGFIALAVVINPLSFYFLTDLGRHTAQAAAAFGAFAWISFLITTVLSALNIFRGNTSSHKHGHNPEISNSVA